MARIQPMKTLGSNFSGLLLCDSIEQKSEWSHVDKLCSLLIKEHSGPFPKKYPCKGSNTDLLGTLLMARSGLSTRTVRMADRLALWPSREYSITLSTERKAGKECFTFLSYILQKCICAHRYIYTKRQQENWENLKYNNDYNSTYPHNYYTYDI